MINPALTMSVSFYSVAFFELFERIGFEKAQQVADAASDISGEHALHCEANQGITYTLPYCDKPQSPIQVIAAVSAFLAWTQIKANHALPQSELLSACQMGWKMYQAKKGKK